MLLSRSLKTMILGCALIAGGCDRQSDAPAQPKAESPGALPGGMLDRNQAGTLLPDLEFSDATGRNLKLRALNGKPVLINLWATWCAPCIAELPMLNELATEQAERMHVLAISQDMANPEKIAPFLAEHGAPDLDPWLDPDTDLSVELGAQTLPTTVLYDAQGREIWRYIGGRDWTSEESAKLIAEAATSAGP